MKKTRTYVCSFGNVRSKKGQTLLGIPTDTNGHCDRLVFFNNSDPYEVLINLLSLVALSTGSIPSLFQGNRVDVVLAYCLGIKGNFI